MQSCIKEGKIPKKMPQKIKMRLIVICKLNFNNSKLSHYQNKIMKYLYFYNIVTILMGHLGTPN